MIQAVLIFNTTGKTRLAKFYDFYEPDRQQWILTQTFDLISSRSNSECHFVETDIFNIQYGEDKSNHHHQHYQRRESPSGSDRTRFLLLYRQYATLYVVFCVDKNENELAILDLIQIFVEALDRCFESICELDIIFNPDKIHYILNEIIIGGLVMETDIEQIVGRFKEQNKIDNKTNTLFGHQVNEIQDFIRSTAATVPETNSRKVPQNQFKIGHYQHLQQL